MCGNLLIGEKFHLVIDRCGIVFLHARCFAQYKVMYNESRKVRNEKDEKKD